MSLWQEWNFPLHTAPLQTPKSLERIKKFKRAKIINMQNGEMTNRTLSAISSFFWFWNTSSVYESSDLCLIGPANLVGDFWTTAGNLKKSAVAIFQTDLYEDHFRALSVSTTSPYKTKQGVTAIQLSKKSECCKSITR